MGGHGGRGGSHSAIKGASQSWLDTLKSAFNSL
jgi:hypothetical protein